MSDVDVGNNSLRVIKICSFSRGVFRLLSFGMGFHPNPSLCWWEKAIPAQLPPS